MPGWLVADILYKLFARLHCMTYEQGPRRLQPGFADLCITMALVPLTLLEDTYLYSQRRAFPLPLKITTIDSVPASIPTYACNRCE